MPVSLPWSPSLRQPAPAAQLTPASLSPPPAGSLKNHQEVDMNVVRICFQASYRDQQGQLRRLEPVLSEPVYDKSESRLPCPLGLTCHGYQKARMSRASLRFLGFRFLHLHSGSLSAVSGKLGLYFFHSFSFPPGHVVRAMTPDITYADGQCHPVCLYSLHLVQFYSYFSFLLYFLLSKFAP